MRAKIKINGQVREVPDAQWIPDDDFAPMLEQYKIFKFAKMTPVYPSRVHFAAGGTQTEWAYSVTIGKKIWTKTFKSETVATEHREKFIEQVNLCKAGPQ